MLVRELWVADNKPGRHHQMPGDAIRVVLAEGLQLGAGNAIEVLRLDVVGDDGVVVPTSNRAQSKGIPVFWDLALSCRAVAASRLAFPGP